MTNINIRYADNSFSIDLENEDAVDPKLLLEEVFAHFNHGSGKEMGVFKVAKCRSMSVGDFVCINGIWYQCDDHGWSIRSHHFVDRWFTDLDMVLKSTSAQISDTRIARYIAMGELLRNAQKSDMRRMAQPIKTRSLMKAIDF